VIPNGTVIGGPAGHYTELEKMKQWDHGIMKTTQLRPSALICSAQRDVETRQRKKLTKGKSGKRAFAKLGRGKGSLKKKSRASTPGQNKNGKENA